MKSLFDQTKEELIAMGYEEKLAEKIAKEVIEDPYGELAQNFVDTMLEEEEETDRSQWV